MTKGSRPLIEVPAHRVRRATKRRNRRFDIDDIIIPAPSEALHELVGKRVKVSSSETYGACLRTIQRFLCKARAVSAADPVSCTEEEYLQLLWNWLRQGMGPAKGLRSALLREQRRQGVEPSFLEKKIVKKATAAASSNATKTQTGVLDREMFRQWKAVLLKTPLCEFGVPCRTCKATMGGANMRERIALAGDFMRNVPVRPGNLQDLRSADDLWVKGLRACNVQRPKRDQQKQVSMSEKGRIIFKAALAKSSDQYLFPKCVAIHLDASLRFAEELFDWPRGLVFSANCLRHSCMTKKIRKVEQARAERDTGVTYRVAKGTYARPLQQRIARTILL